MTSDSPERLPFLKRVQQAHPGDFWANLTLGDVLAQRMQPAEAVRYYQAAVAIRPGTALGYYKLGMAGALTGRTEEAVEQLRRAVDLDPSPSRTTTCLAVRLVGDRAGTTKPSSSSERPSAATPTSPASTPPSGNCLEACGAVRGGPRPTTDRPSRSTRTTRTTKIELRALLVRLGRGDEARVAWRRSLEADPPGHDDWYGYAEFCLFLGQEDEYRRARQALLARFGATTDPHVAERTARACLLLPATGDELRQAVALAERAAAVEPRRTDSGVYPLLPVRPGPGGIPSGAVRPGDRAMRGDASRALGPAPRLVLAMALHRSGQAAEARQNARGGRPGPRLEGRSA